MEVSWKTITRISAEKAEGWLMEATIMIILIKWFQKPNWKMVTISNIKIKENRINPLVL